MMYATGLMLILPILAVISISLLWVMIEFIRMKGFYALMILAIIFAIAWFKITLEIENMEQSIKDKSIEKFGIEPEYIEINFNVLRSGGGKPHAIVEKNNKVYYWSFRENDFVFYYTNLDDGWEEATNESIEKLINKYVFKENSTLERVKKN